MPLLDDEDCALRRDAADPLARFRERFYLPADTIYLDGNSLGLISRDSEDALLRALDQWKRLGIAGWTQAEPPWFDMGEQLGAMMAPLIGAQPDEVVATGTIIVNLHSLIATFYHPADSVFAAAPLYGSLQIFAEAGLEAIREKSLALTDYLIELLDELAGPPYHFVVGIPRDHHRRGGHVAVEHPEAVRIGKALKARGVIPDFRPPNAVRLAPIAFYNSFHEVWQTARHLKEIVDREEYRSFPPGRDRVA